MARPSKIWGRVKCGYSRRPGAKLSSSVEAWSPSTPGISRTDGLDQGHGGDLAPRQHEIAERDFLDLRAPRSPAGPGPRTGRRAGPRRDRRPGPAPAPGSAARRAAKDRSADGHRAATASIAAAATSARITMPGPPPAGRVVHRAMLAQAMIADVAHLQRPEIVRQRLAQQRDAQRPGKHLRETASGRCASSTSASPSATTLPLWPARR